MLVVSFSRSHENIFPYDMDVFVVPYQLFAQSILQIDAPFVINFSMTESRIYKERTQKII